MPKRKSKKNIREKNKDSLKKLFKKKKSSRKPRKKRKAGEPQIIYSKKVRGKKGVRKKPSSFPKPKYQENVSLRQKYVPETVTLNSPDKKAISRRTINRLVLILVLSCIVVLFLLVAFFLYSYVKNPSKYLETNDNVKKAFVKEGVLHVELAGGLQEVEKIRFIFLGKKEYYRETSEIKINHQFSASDLGISSFQDLEKVSAVLE
jgi:hypothetical protein